MLHLGSPTHGHVSTAELRLLREVVSGAHVYLFQLFVFVIVACASVTGAHDEEVVDDDDDDSGGAERVRAVAVERDTLSVP